MEYQKYYLFSLSRYLGNTITKSYPYPGNLQKFLIRANITRCGNYINHWLNRLGGRISPEAALAYENHNSHVGQYILSEPDGKNIKFAIDAHDAGEITSSKLLDWSDIYFKSNFWPKLKYPEKVTPIINGNPLLVSGGGEKRLKQLQRLRNSEKEWDVVFVSRLWGGIEHNTRLFEALAGLNCKKYLLAIFTPGIINDKENLRKFENRFIKAGVKFSYHTMPLRQLWQLSASSRLVILRAGKYHCIPWRMLDLLVMGACVVCDSNFYPEWPIPLLEGENYFNLGINRPEDGSPGRLEDYQMIPKIIREALDNREFQKRIRSNNIQYFDSHCSPRQVARYVLSKLRTL